MSWATRSDVDQATVARLQGRYYGRHSLGRDIRLLELRAGGTIGEGATPEESHWTVRTGEAPVLVLGAGPRPTCELIEDDRGIWRSRGHRSEDAGIEIYTHRGHQLADLLRARARGPVRGAEIGVLRGFTSRLLLSQLPELTLCLVDSWTAVDAGSDYHASEDPVANMSQADLDEAFARTVEATREFAHRCLVVRADCHAAAGFFADEGLDFVFLDADHSYSGVIRSFEAWYPKVRPGGLAAGHDYAFPYFRFRVKEAVDEIAARLGVQVEVGPDFLWYFTKPG